MPLALKVSEIQTFMQTKQTTQVMIMNLLYDMIYTVGRATVSSAVQQLNVPMASTNKRSRICHKL